MNWLPIKGGTSIFTFNKINYVFVFSIVICAGKQMFILLKNNIELINHGKLVVCKMKKNYHIFLNITTIFTEKLLEFMYVVYYLKFRFIHLKMKGITKYYVSSLKSKTITRKE